MTIDIPEDVALAPGSAGKAKKDANIGDLLRDLLERYTHESNAKETRRGDRGRLCPKRLGRGTGISATCRYR